MRVIEQLAAVELTPSEQRVADIVERDPASIAFETMAALTERAGVGAGTVARLCAKAGFGGFADLQRAVQAELVGSLRPAAERIKERGVTDLQVKLAAAEADNVRRTFDAARPDQVAVAADALADLRRHVVLATSEPSLGIMSLVAGELSLLRPNVELLTGSPLAVARRLALGDDRDVVVAMDLRRYDAWLVDTVERFDDAGAYVIGLSVSTTSPIARRADVHLVLHADSPGPFDSFVGALALLNLLTATVAGKLRRSASDRLAKVEQAWNDTGVLR